MGWGWDVMFWKGIMGVLVVLWFCGFVIACVYRGIVPMLTGGGGGGCGCMVDDGTVGKV